MRRTHVTQRAYVTPSVVLSASTAENWNVITEPRGKNGRGNEMQASPPPALSRAVSLFTRSSSLVAHLSPSHSSILSSSLASSVVFLSRSLFLSLR